MWRANSKLTCLYGSDTALVGKNAGTDCGGGGPLSYIVKGYEQYLCVHVVKYHEAQVAEVLFTVS